MIDGLKNCPFCNGKAFIERESTRSVSGIISCEDCGCFQEASETWVAIQTWNTRRGEGAIIEALKVLGPFELVNGDCGKRLNPHNNVNLNTNIAWVVGKGERSAHKQRGAMYLINSLLKDKEND